MGKGSSGQTTTTSNSPPPEVMAQYSNLIGQANQVAQNPLQQYGGQMIAGFTPDQNNAMQTVNNAQGISKPFINNAQTMLQNSTSPLWSGVQQYSPQAVQQYYNPYQQDVVNSTMANINETNAQQNQQVVGNAISSGAWGGDRASVAQSELARQQGLASNQVLGQLQQQGFTGAQNQFNQQQGAQLGANTTNAWLNSQGAFGEANLGNQLQSNTLQGAAAQLATGQQQQTLAQSALNIPYEQFLQQQAYPYQNLSWLSSLSTGLGSGMGGTGSTTTPGPSGASQAIGTGLGILGTAAMFMKKGGGIPSTGFSPIHRDIGGMIPNIDLSYIPSNVQMTRGNGVPQAPKAPAPQQNNNASQMVGLMAQLGKKGMGAAGGAEPLASRASTGFDVANAQANGMGDMMQGFQKPNGTTNLASPVDINGDSVAYGSPDASWLGGIMGKMGMARGGYADGGPMGDDDAAKIVDLYGDGADSSPYDSDLAAAKGFTPNSLPTPPAAAGITPADKYGAMPTYDGAGAAPINKVNPWMALASAGFGMAAGQSPHALTNIATGAQEGIKNLQSQQEEAAKESYQQGTLKQQGEQLYDKANEWRNQLFQTGEHQKATESQAQNQLEETARHNKAQEAHEHEALLQGKFTMSPYGQVLNTRTGEVTGTPLGSQPMPLGADGKPMQGDVFMDYVKQNDPDRAMRAQMLIDGDKKVPPLSSRSDPGWRQAILDARIADPTFSEERYNNKQKFEADNKGQMDSFNTIPSHLQVLEQAAHAIDNGDSRALNMVKNTWNKQFGSELPTNLDTARTLVSAEIVKAITGAGGVTDREDAQKKFSDSASNGQLSGAIDMTKHLIGERINSAAFRYKQTVGGDYYKYIRPDVKSYLGVGTTIDPTGGGNAAPAGGAAPAGAPAGGAPKTIVKTQTSPSTGRKRIIYSDGTQEIQ